MASFQKWLSEQAPDYTFDKWVAGAEQLKGDLGSMVVQSRSKDKELDDEAQEKEKEAKAKDDKKKKPSKKEVKDAEDTESKTFWTHLKKTAEDMSKERKLERKPDARETDRKGTKGSKK